MDKLNKVFNILGIKVYSQIKSPKQWPKYKSQVTSYEDLLIIYYIITFDLNIGKIPYSILWLLTRNLNKKATGDKLIIFDTEIFPIIDLYSENKIEINIGPKELITNYLIPCIDPSSIEEAYRLIIEKLLYIFEDCTDTVEVRLYGKEEFPTKEIINSFINNNKDFTNVTIPNDIVKQVSDIIPLMNNRYKIYKEIEENNPLLFNLLKNKKDTISKLGKLGF